MITIFKDDPVAGRDDLFVYSPSGDYNQVDLIECYHSANPNVPVCAYAAQMVKYGDVVYQQEQPLNENQVEALKVNAPMDKVLNNEDLMEGKIDPESLAEDAPVEAYKPEVKKKVKPVKEETVEQEVPVEVVESPVAPVEPVEEIVTPEPELQTEPEIITPDPQVGDVVGESVE